MRFAGTNPARPFPDPAVPVLPWPDGQVAPELPAGRGGIAVRTWYGSRWDRRYPETARNVGVGGNPLWHGWGRMVAVVEPGDHLVEVREEWAEGACLVSVRAGEISELEYVGPRNWGGRGLLAAPPVRELGATMRPWLLAFGALMAVLLCLPYTGIAEAVGNGLGSTFAAVAALAAAIAIPLLWNRYRRRREAAYRAEKSDEARLVTDRASGWFLGHTPRSVPVPGAGFGGLLVEARSRHRLGTGQAVAGNRHAWLPAPRLRIDGREHPTSWACWWYPLPAGVHEVTFTPPHPDLPEGVVAELEPVTVRVDIREDRTRRLTVRATAWTDLRATRDPLGEQPVPYRGWEPPTEVAGHRHEIEVRIQ